MLRFTASFWRHNLQRVSSSSRAFATTAWWKLRTFKVVAVLRVKTKTQRRWYPQQSGGLHYKVDINYHLFKAPWYIDLQCNLKQALWQSTKVNVQKHTFNVQNYTFKVQEYTCKVQIKYIYTFKVHQNTKMYKGTTFGTLETESPEPGTFLIPRVPRTQFPEPAPSKPREQNLTCQNPSNTETFETSGGSPEPEPVPGTQSPERPQLAQNTPKSILCKNPIAFCCWGINWKESRHWRHKSMRHTEALQNWIKKQLLK